MGEMMGSFKKPAFFRMRKKSFPLLLICLFFFVQSPAQAIWSEDGVDWFNRFKQAPVLFTDGFVNVAWSFGRMLLKFNSGPNSITKVKTPLLASGYAPVAMYAQEVKAGGDYYDYETAKRPLIVLLSGAFSESDSDINRYIAKLFYKQGYHVAAVPNTWAQDVLLNKPKFTLVDPVEEARFILSLLPGIKKRFGEENITKVHVVGQSYGAFLALVVDYLDKTENESQIDGEFTLLSPPIRFDYAFNQLDYYLNKSENEYFSYCESLLHKPKLLLSLISSDSEEQLKPELKECSESWVVWQGFHLPLAEADEIISHQLHRRIRFKARDQLKRRDFRMNPILRKHFPEVDLTEEKYDLLYWVNKMNDLDIKNYRFLLAENDFLLDLASQVYPLKTKLDENQVMVLDWGGHLGYKPTELFKALIKSEFKKQTSH